MAAALGERLVSD